MRKFLFLFLFTILTMTSYSQTDNFPMSDQGKIQGGLGLNWMDGQLYYSFNLRPEISFLNFGVGLDLKLDFDQNGKLRKENFNEFSDYLSIIRYVRYGLKGDPLFVKLGALDYYTLGYGNIMYNYNNSPSYDVRKTGLVLDIDFGQLGFESIYSTFGEAGVVGLRAYMRPLQFTELGAIPIIGKLEVGASYAGDFNKNAGIVSGIYDTLSKQLISRTDNGALNVVGLDIGLPLLSTRILGVKLYADYTKIIDFGHGAATGIIVNVNTLGLVTAQAKLERRFNGKNYIPSYFDPMYEVERFQLNPVAGNLYEVNSKIRQLAEGVTQENGYYGDLGVSILNTLYVIGSYQRLDKSPETGKMHLATEIAPESMPFVARAGYDKINIKNEKDLFTLDDRSYLYAEVGYKPMPYMLVSMIYNWTFTPVRDYKDRIVDYKPIKRIEPRVTFVYPFNL